MMDSESGELTHPRQPASFWLLPAALRWKLADLASTSAWPSASQVCSWRSSTTKRNCMPRLTLNSALLCLRVVSRAFVLPVLLEPLFDSAHD